MIKRLSDTYEDATCFDKHGVEGGWRLIWTTISKR